MDIRKLTRVSVLCALALIIFMVENLFPPIFAFAPGSKLGLSGMIVTLTIILYGEKSAAAVLLVKCVLGSFFSGNVFMLYYSLPAGIVSLIAGSLLIRFFMGKISVITVSVISALLHNVMQIIMAALLLQNVHLLYYIMLMSVAGCAAGAVTGTALYFLIRYVPQKTLIGE